MKSILRCTGAIVAIAVSGPSWAADLPYKAAPAPATFSWTGCYVGGNAGWVDGTRNYQLAPSGSYLNPTGAAAPPNGAGTGDFATDIQALTHSYSGGSSGGLVGAQVGCNQQVGLFVIGGEVDWQWTSLKNSVDVNYPAFANIGNPGFTDAAHTEHVSSKLDWFSTFRVRAGFTWWDNVLVYATGGLAVGNVQSDTNVTFGTVAVNPVYDRATHIGSQSLIKAGWVLGGGVEYAFAPNWSLKGEYLFVDLGSSSYSSPLVSAVPAAAVGQGYSWSTRVHEHEQVARVGLNYKLDWSGFVGAKY